LKRNAADGIFTKPSRIRKFKARADERGAKLCPGGDGKFFRGSLTRPFSIHYNTIHPFYDKIKGEELMEARPDLHKRGYELMDSGLN